MVATSSSGHGKGSLKADYYPPVAHIYAGPRISRILELDKPLTEERLANLLNLRTATGEVIPGKRAQRHKMTYLDVTFSAPLSFSVALALAPTERERAILEECFDRANEATARELGKRLGMARTRINPQAGEVACLSFAHQAARPTAGKAAGPQRHNHNVFIHAAALPDGRVLTPNANELRRRLHAYGGIFHAYLATNLRRHGVNVGVDERTGLSTLLDVPQRALDLYGDRRKEAVGDTPKARRWSLASTRRAKDGEPSLAEWRQRARDAGYRHESVLGRGGKAPRPSEAALHTNRAQPITVAARRLIITGITDQAQVDAVLGPTKGTPSPELKMKMKMKGKGNRPMDIEQARASLEEQLRARGAKLTGPIRMDGEWDRVAVEGDKGRTMSGRYRAFIEGIIPAGYMCNYRNPALTGPIKANMPPREITPDDRRQMAQQTAEREQQAHIRSEVGRDKAIHIWRNAEPARIDHPYLMRKDIQPYHARQDRYGNLVIGLFNAEGGLSTVQLINGDGGKFFIANAPKAGAFGQLGTALDGDPIVIAEGYATAATIHEMTGLPVRFAIDANNLRDVALITRKQFPHSSVIMAADNDHTLPRRTDIPEIMRVNVGIKKASEAASAIGNSIVVAPYFGAIEQGPYNPDRKYPTDWNDKAKLEGKPAAGAEFLKLVKQEGINVKTRAIFQEEKAIIKLTHQQREEARSRTPVPQYSNEQLARINREWQLVAQARNLGHNKGPVL